MKIRKLWKLDEPQGCTVLRFILGDSLIIVPVKASRGGVFEPCLSLFILLLSFFS
jgi:hypothetical protein